MSPGLFQDLAYKIRLPSITGEDSVVIVIGNRQLPINIPCSIPMGGQFFIPILSYLCSVAVGG